MSKNDADLAIAFVATSSSRLPAVQKIVDAISRSTQMAVADQDAAWDESTLMIEHRHGWIAITHAQGPIPWSDLEGPCATAWWWPEATKVMAAHTGQFIVAIQRGEYSKLQRRLLLTHVVSAIVQNSDALGIYWGEGTLVHQPERFVTHASMARAGNPPTHLWVDARVQMKAERKCRCFTTGLSHFGLMEIEVDDSTMPPEDLFSFVINVAGYLIGRDANINDGETVGIDATRQYKVRHRPSMFGRKDVMRIEIP